MIECIRQYGRPGFFTRAESEAHRQLGFDVVCMANLPEAKLAREAEISLATLAMITDYNCWKNNEKPVTAAAIIAHSGRRRRRKSSLGDHSSEKSRGSRMGPKTGRSMARS